MRTNLQIFAISTVLGLIALLGVTLFAFLTAGSEEELSSMEWPAIFVIGLVGVINAVMMGKRYSKEPKMKVVALAAAPYILFAVYLAIK